MPAVRTTRLPDLPDDASPAGAAEIRTLLSFPVGGVSHATVPAGAVSRQSWLSGSSEWFHVLDGDGVLWDGAGGQEVPLLRGRTCRIPPSTPFQYRAGAQPLRLLVMTLPRWRPEDHHVDVEQHWAPTGAGATEPVPHPGGGGPVEVHDLRAEPDDTAPDGSLIFLQGDEPAGGVAGCVLPAGTASVPVRHATVEELWYVLGGSGQLSRRDGTLPPEVVDLVPGTCVDIARGLTFQFRAAEHELLHVLLLTMPRWPGPQEATPVRELATWT